MMMEVESHDWSDAQRVAEGAVHHLIGLGNCADAGQKPLIKWRHRNGVDYEVVISRRPIELGAAARNGCFTVEVVQPLTEVNDG